MPAPVENRDVPLKRSVALAIRGTQDPTLVLVVLRPPDDEELPDVWGLPAASLRRGESWAQAVRRAAREKLGVEVEVGDVRAQGARSRSSYQLEMRLYEAVIEDGEPRLDQPLGESTRYVDWKWAPADVLTPAAEKGSLCAKLFLESV